jgi:hypothetical protein
MSHIHITKNGEESAFSKPLKRALLRDKRLSYGARGLFAMLWDYPSNWTYYLSNIVEMSPNGMFQLKRYINELKFVGAIVILPRRLSGEEAKTKSESNEKHYKAGQLSGWNWILNHPDLWAVEATLAKTSPKDRFPDLRENRPTEKSSGGQSSTKGLQFEGSTNTRPLLLANEIAKVAGSSTDYIFPKQLKPQECELAKSQLDSIDSVLAQAVLDELSARLNANKVTGAPLSYLRSLITRAKTGQFMPEAGIRVASAREQAKLAQIKKAADVIKPSNPSEVPKHLAAMHQVLSRKSTSDLNQED